MSSLLKKIKSGKKNHKIINYPGTEEKVAIVTLASSQVEICKIKSEAYIKEKNITDEHYQDLVLQRYMVYEFLRDKDNLDKKIADSVDELSDSMDTHELAYFITEYNMLTNENSPFLGSITEEEFEKLKKTLPTMNWKDLNGESLLALRNFLLSLV